MDRRDVAAVTALARARQVRVVIDLLAYTESDTLPLLDAFEGLVERWIMTSSCDVYRNYEGLHRKAACEPLPLLAENAPLRTTRYPYRTGRPAEAADAWLDAYDKIPLEEALRARSDHVILRLPMVFGPGDKQRRFRWLLKPMLAGGDRLTVARSWAAWRTSYGYVEDVADAIATAALHPAAAGRTFNLGPPDAPDHHVWIDRFLTALDWKGEVVEASALNSGPLSALDLSYPLILDTGAFRDSCDWREPTSLDQALAHTIDDERSRG